MCGVNGVVSFRGNTNSLIAVMNRHLAHRGPNGDGFFVDDAVALGHVRLSILDLTSAGAQPMEYGRWVITYNGEIYNYIDLKNKLFKYGYQFNSRCDTEVLLKAWDHWGVGCLEKIDGMFAFAVYDKHKRCLYLCRDNYGVKPLFYSTGNKELIFSSELSTLTKVQCTLPEIDHDAISTFLALHYVPFPKTGLKNVYKLPAGHLLKIQVTGENIEISGPFSWGRQFKPEDCAPGISLDALDKALAQSVKNQMVSDVPVGAFLSGGVDSSLICYYASKIHREPLHTFSIGFTDAGVEYDETRYAEKAAGIVGAQHHAVQVKLSGLTDKIETIIDGFGELNADTSVFLNHIICEEARKYVTVCLSGAGGDEIFGGYYRHQALLALKFLNMLPKPAIETIKIALSPLPQNRDNKVGNLVRRLNRFLDQRLLEGNDFLTLLRQDSIFLQQSKFFDRPAINCLLDALQFDFSHFLGDNILSFTDKMSMLHGLEVRVPFLNPTVVALAEKMRNNQRVTITNKKIMLKQLAINYFPRDLIYRKKQGFAAPLEVWMRQLSKIELINRCVDGIALNYVSESIICKMIDDFYLYKKDVSLQLYVLIILNKWYYNITSFTK